MADNSAYVNATRRAMTRGVKSDPAVSGAPPSPSGVEAVAPSSGKSYSAMRDEFLSSNLNDPDPDLGESPSQFEPETPESDEETGETIPDDEMAELPTPAPSAEPSGPMPGDGGPAAQPGTYGAEGDPYQYRVNADGSVTIVDGPTGKGHTIREGNALKAILAQVSSGQLTLGAGGRPKLMTAPDGGAGKPLAMRSPSPQAANRIPE